MLSYAITLNNKILENEGSHFFVSLYLLCCLSMLYFISFYISFNFMYASQLENFLEISSSLILFTFFVINYPQQLQWKQRKGISMHPPDDWIIGEINVTNLSILSFTPVRKWDFPEMFLRNTYNYMYICMYVCMYVYTVSVNWTFHRSYWAGLTTLLDLIKFYAALITPKIGPLYIGKCCRSITLRRPARQI